MKNNKSPQGEEDQSPYLSRVELATRYRIHPGTVDIWRRKGIFPSSVIEKTRRFPVKECDEIWAANASGGAQ